MALSSRAGSGGDGGRWRKRGIERGRTWPNEAVAVMMVMMRLLPGWGAHFSLFLMPSGWLLISIVACLDRATAGLSGGAPCHTFPAGRIQREVAFLYSSHLHVAVERRRRWIRPVAQDPVQAVLRYAGGSFDPIWMLDEVLHLPNDNPTWTLVRKRRESPGGYESRHTTRTGQHLTRKYTWGGIHVVEPLSQSK